ncbi:MAG TPA: radical SAM protein [Candidatus Acidoferrales bacterium]|nr:radical SAM protein [Candidatus Acidoferrales bacterium]
MTLQEAVKRDADHVFFELTRSICPTCRRVIDAQVLLRDGRVFMRKRCPEHGWFEAHVYGDADAYVRSARFNKPGTLPLAFGAELKDGCPYDCGLCPQHQQHVCVGIIEVNSACNMACPLCFANAGAGFSLALGEVEAILDDLVRTEGRPEVVQFSGGEPSIHPEIEKMLRAARERPIRHVMLNTNGKRIARDDRFLQLLAELRVSIYFQFDGFERETYRVLRGEPDILEEKLHALDRLAQAGCRVILVPAVEQGVNQHELGRIVRFGIEHPAVFGVNFQPAFHAGRHQPHDPLRRLTIPDLLREIEKQTEALFRVSDFIPVPCCFPTCNSVSYAWIDGSEVLPLTRLLEVDRYLDYISNRAFPDTQGVRRALEGLWSSSAVPGTVKAAADLAISCAACDLDGLSDLGLKAIADRMFMVMLQDFMDPWTLNQKNLMKCCKAILLPGGSQVPFCAYNSLGYREQARAQLTAWEPERKRWRRSGRPPEPRTIEFSFPR